MDAAELIEREEPTRVASISGLGPLTIAWMRVLTVHFGVCPTPEAAANDAGLAPRSHESRTGGW